LEGLNGKFAAEEKEREVLVTQLEEIVAEGERHVTALEHREEETAERTQAMTDIEGQISSQA
jgi:hypothetical protein